MKIIIHFILTYKIYDSKLISIIKKTTQFVENNGVFISDERYIYGRYMFLEVNALFLFNNEFIKKN